MEPHGEAHHLQLLAPAAEHDDPPGLGDHRHRPHGFVKETQKKSPGDLAPARKRMNELTR